MIINIGSKNLIKVEAVQEILKNYSHLKMAEIIATESESGVNNQPKSLEETIKGAMNRAKNSFNNCTYSFGIESGLMTVPHTKTGYMDVCVCAIFDGKEYYLGLSSAWEPPKKIADYMLK